MHQTTRRKTILCSLEKSVITSGKTFSWLTTQSKREQLWISCWMTSQINLWQQAEGIASSEVPGLMEICSPVNKRIWAKEYSSRVVYLTGTFNPCTTQMDETQRILYKKIFLSIKVSTLMFKNILFYVFKFLPACICVSHACLVPVEARNKC